MKRLSLVFVVAFLAMSIMSGAAEEQPWCGEFEELVVVEPEMLAMVTDCVGVLPQQMVACCTTYAQGAYAQCYEYYYNFSIVQCQQQAYVYCYNFVYNSAPPECFYVSACMEYFGQNVSACLNSWEVQQMINSCSWDWVNYLIPMYCQSEMTAAFSACMSGN